ncbi:hypothetical protein ABBQ38_000602 [Trebouxia sp. C0009 RCD-2024]
MVSQTMFSAQGTLDDLAEATNGTASADMRSANKEGQQAMPKTPKDDNIWAGCNSFISTTNLGHMMLWQKGGTSNGLT